MVKHSHVPELKKELELLPLDVLHLDPENPRFGGTVGARTGEVELLDTIAGKFGVDDLLSSLSINGYFGSEPIVGYRPKRKAGDDKKKKPQAKVAEEKDEDFVVIAEGNRRLTACLILEGDPRAQNQTERTDKFNYEGRPKITRIPVLVYDDKVDLLSFMGVRHIAAPNPWDSFAKAHWVAQMLEDGQFELDEIVQMIGDQHNTIERMLEGYYVVKQLVDANKWDPSTSTRAGRGSNPHFPFSWVYTALSFSGTRNWLQLAPAKATPKPIPPASLDKASEFMGFMFGNGSTKQKAAIEDSREIVRLATAVHDARQYASLRAGRSLDAARREAVPPLTKIEDGLGHAKDALGEVSAALGEANLTSKEAERVQGLSLAVRRLAIDTHKRIVHVVHGDEDGDE